MYCPNCGKAIPDNSKWCQYCGQGTKVNTSIGSVNSNTNPVNSIQEDKPKIFLNIISVLIPFVGWILWFAQKETKPQSAKMYSTLAWIGFAINFIIILSA